MRLWDKIRRVFTIERLIWGGATILTAAVFLVIGLTAPRSTDLANGRDVTQSDITTATTTSTASSTAENITTTTSTEVSSTTTTTTTHHSVSASTTSTSTTTTTTTTTTASTTGFINTTTSGDNISDKIPINSATKEQLMTVPGIGEVFSQRIIDYRDVMGGFADLSELMNIQGIGQKRYNQWKEYFTLD